MKSKPVATLVVLAAVALLPACAALEQSAYLCPFPDQFNCGLSFEEAARRSNSVNTYESRFAEWQHCKQFEEPYGAYCGMEPRRYE